MSLAILIFGLRWPFCKANSLSIVAFFARCGSLVIYPILAFFLEPFLIENNSDVSLETLLASFLAILIFEPN